MMQGVMVCIWHLLYGGIFLSEYPAPLEDPYAVPNDLQELIRRIQRLQNADEVDFVATLWSWWRHQPIPSTHPRVPDHELLRKS